MKIHVQRHSLLITPDNQHDLAFIEDTLGMRQMGDYVVLRRVVVPVGDGIGGIVGLETMQLATSSDADPAAKEPNTTNELLKVSDDDDSGTPPATEMAS